MLTNTSLRYNQYVFGLNVRMCNYVCTNLHRWAFIINDLLFLLLANNLANK